MFQSPDNSGAARGTALRHILVVDDEPTLRLGFAYALTNAYTKVETASCGRIALDKIAEAHFDLIILDLRMPDIDGIGVIESLRRAGNQIPIVLCSAALTPGAALKAIRNSVVDFLLKPVHPADLREVVQFILNSPEEPIARALKSAREGRLEDAVEVLAEDQAPSKRSSAWLDFLKSLLAEDRPDDATLSDRLLRFTLSSLAFRAAHTA
ncbi:response regulator [Luteolibacter pohnpeiensis]|uniref:Response regulator n=1 Tax=Luteolibacter pohnpeiensis TaxID=454153 RepID=A0A934S6E8_9BACT|nr:response regulator [Luteolibacter pohnpeiensis]MBK1883481.1 response regulator [Luteolibacter pohnpeiensis]